MENKFTATELLKSSVNIENHLTDELSKKIYDIRLQYLIDRNNNSFQNNMKTVCQTIDENSKLNFIEKSVGKFDTIVIFGSGKIGRYAFNLLTNSKYKSKNFIFCDNDSSKWNTKIFDTKIVSPEELIKNYYDSIVIVGAAFKNKIDINKQLMELKFPKERIITGCFSKFFGWQYFDYLKSNENEIFIDVGSLDGLTSVDFVSWATKGYDYIYAFEANQNSVKNAEIIFKAFEIKGQVVNKGLWDKEETINFKVDDQPGASMISESGSAKIETVTLDDFLNVKKTTLIKMDIEGAEFKALLGAEKTIKKYRPRLAISIYHKPEDILELPTLLLEMQPDYKFALRQYAPNGHETILYAY